MESIIEQLAKLAASEAKKCECCGKSPCQCPPSCSCGCKQKSAASKPGLWDNIHAKRKRGGKPAKPGDEAYPDSKNWKKVTEISEKEALATKLAFLLKEAKCWEGYERVPGTKPMTPGSCQPVGKKKTKTESEKKASPAWQTSEGKSESGGLNDKGRASLKAQGHDIKRPQPEGGPRKDSFCARMKGMKAKLTSSETANDPDSRINKSLRKWKCGSAADTPTEAMAKLAANNVFSQIKQYSVKESADISDVFKQLFSNFDINKAAPYMSGFLNPVMKAVGGVAGLPGIAALLDLFKGGQNMSTLGRGMFNQQGAQSPVTPPPQTQTPATPQQNPQTTTPHTGVSVPGITMNQPGTQQNMQAAAAPASAPTTAPQGPPPAVNPIESNLANKQQQIQNKLNQTFSNTTAMKPPTAPTNNNPSGLSRSQAGKTVPAPVM